MNNTTVRPWRRDEKGLTITVRLTPRGGRDSIDGMKVLSDGREVLLARVRSVPEDGAANAALMKLLAKVADIPLSAMHIVSGQTSRLKIVHLSGDCLRIEAALNASIAMAETKLT